MSAKDKIKAGASAAVTPNVGGVSAATLVSSALAWALESYVFRGPVPLPVAACVPVLAGWAVHWAATYLARRKAPAHS